MFWFCVWQIVSTLIDLIRLGHPSESEKDLQILLLRRQLAIYERKHDRVPNLSRGEKLTLVVLATKLKARTGRTIKGMGDAIANRDHDVTQASIERWAAGFENSLAMCREAGVDDALPAAIKRNFDRALAAGLGGKEMTAIF